MVMAMAMPETKASDTWEIDKSLTSSVKLRRMEKPSSGLSVNVDSSGDWLVFAKLATASPTQMFMTWDCSPTETCYQT